MCKGGQVKGGIATYRMQEIYSPIDKCTRFWLTSIKKDMRLKLFFGIALFALSFAPAFSQDINTVKLDSLFDILAKNNKAMGSIAISKNGKMIYSKSIGNSFISPAKNMAAGVTTKYRIGSISKMFTAVMIFQLIEEGKLSLATLLSVYFPDLPNAGKITIGNLLNHSSGLHNFTDDQAYTAWMTTPKSQKEMLAVISKSKVDFEPNEKASYSNSNFVVLGYIIEKLARVSYSKQLHDKIAVPLGLKDTYVGGKANIDNNESLSYEYNNGWQQLPETDMSIPGGAGAIVSTPADLVTFIEMLFSGKIISQASLDKMKTITNGFGMGIFQVPFYDKKAYGHTGGIDGFESNLAYFPEDHLAVSFCGNGVIYPINDIMIGVLSICFQKPYYLPKFGSVVLAAADLDKYLGTYASIALPLKITITKDGNMLRAQATGQSAFPLEAVDKDIFTFEQAGIEMRFQPAKNTLLLKQAGGSYVFIKE